MAKPGKETDRGGGRPQDGSAARDAGKANVSAAGKATERVGDVRPEHDAFQPYVPSEDASVREFTWPAVVAGSLLGIVFAASSLYLVLKVGMSVSASIPIAVLSISLFRGLSRLLRLRGATILENNMVQTVGSAGESIAFGVGVTMPALMLLGYELDVWRVMTVGVLGGLLGILMMIPLRRAFIVKQHGKLPYPEGTACAEVLVAGERGGSSAITVFSGFFLAFAYKLLTNPLSIFHDVANWNLFRVNAAGQTVGLHKAVVGGEFTPELLGVGYIIGPRIGGITFAGGVLAYLVIAPAIALFGENLQQPLYPSQSVLIRDMDESALRSFYILYIGAGAVATGGVISMARSLPVIGGAIRTGVADILRMGRATADGTSDGTTRRTDRDISMAYVLGGALLLVTVLTVLPKVGLGLSWFGLTAALLVLGFGFLFVTVSSRLTGEIGSSSNPISGMTVATLLLTCLIFLLLNQVDRTAMLLALTIAAVVCVASSNGGTTAQDLKTGYLVGATPKLQQYGILIGALTSALVLGGTLLVLNQAGTHYTNLPENLPPYRVPDGTQLTETERPGRPHTDDTSEYKVLHATEGQYPSVPPGKYLVDDSGAIRYVVDPAINGRFKYLDPDAKRIAEATTDAERAAAVASATPLPKYDAPKTKLMAFIIDGILNQKLPWSLVLIGVLAAVTMELAGVASLPFAVGIYLPIQTSFPIFLGGLVRWLADRRNAGSESDSSPGVLLSSGLIAGGALAGVLAASLRLAPDEWGWMDKLNLGPAVDRWFADFGTRSLGMDPGGSLSASRWPTMVAFGILSLVLIVVAVRRPGEAAAIEEA